MAIVASERSAAALPPPPRLALILLTLAIFVLSGGVLWVLGLNYDGLTGAAASKIHPATYGAVLIFAWQAARSGRPVAFVAALARLWPGAILLLVATAVLFLHIVATGGHNMAGTIDTFVLTILLVAITANLDDAGRLAVERIIHAVMIANAVMALIEFALDVRVFPFVFDGEPLIDTRSTALQGHPLSNATVTTCYLLVLLSGAGAAIGPRLRTAAALLNLAALVAFGGRSAILVALVLGGLQVGARVLRRVRNGRISLATAAVVLFAAPTLLGLGVALAATGFFAPLLLRFRDDGGSAEARLLMFDLVSQIPWRDLLVGPDPAFVDSLRRIAGLELGIENPVVSFLVYQGVLITILLVASFALFLWDVARHLGRGIAVPLVGFLVLINTFEGLASKSILFGKFILMLIVFYPPPHGPSAEASNARRRASPSA